MQPADASMFALIAMGALGFLLVLVLFRLRIAGWRWFWTRHKYSPMLRAGETGVQHRRRYGVIWLWYLVGVIGVLVACLGVLGGVAGGPDAWQMAARVVAVVIGAGLAGAAILAGAKAQAADPKDPFPRDHPRARDER